MKLVSFIEHNIVRLVTILATVAFSFNGFAGNRKTSNVSKREKPHLFSSNSHQKLSFLEKKQEINSIDLEKRLWEFRTAPIALLAKWYTLDVSYRLSDNWATGPAVILFNADEPAGMLGPSYNGYALGWNGNYYFDSAYKRTWYISAHGYYESYKSYLHGYRGYKDMAGYKFNSAIGYQWKWSRINMIAGIGQEYRDQTVTDKTESIKTIEQQTSDSTKAVWFTFFEFKVGIEI